MAKPLVASEVLQRLQALGLKPETQAYVLRRLKLTVPRHLAEGGPAGGAVDNVAAEDDGIDDTKSLALDSNADPSLIRVTDAVSRASQDYDSTVKEGGTPAWRNNNPGNIEAGDWAMRHGATGRESGGKRRFAVFPSEEAGMNALKGLLGGETYSDLLPPDAIKQYAPAKDGNDPKSYAKTLGKLGVDLNKPVQEQIDKMAEGIKRVEGWKAGKTREKGFIEKLEEALQNFVNSGRDKDPHSP